MVEHGRAVFEGGYLHGRELVDIFAPTVVVPGLNGKYISKGRLENGKRLFRWEPDVIESER